ncbi:glycosyltransferase, partial [Enterococcus faecium]|nr:glycosyltransferase [Enterococcus faecium]
MTIDIICPLYNAEGCLESLNESLLMQENVSLNSIKYILTRSNDKTEEILKKIGVEYYVIEPEEFSHSISREITARKSDADIIVFISQDIK